jgi:hypothetical protein
VEIIKISLSYPAAKQQIFSISSDVSMGLLVGAILNAVGVRNANKQIQLY